VAFDVWLDDLQLFLQCDSRDGLSLFDLTSGASTAPAADADSTVRSQGAARGGVEPGGSGSGGAEPGGAEPRGAASGGANPGAAGSGGVELAGAGPGGPSGSGAAVPAGAPGARTGGAAGVGATGGTGAGGAAGVGADAGGAGVVPAGSRGVARQRPYFVPLLEQVLGLPPSSGPAPSLECPPPVLSDSQLRLASPLPAPSPYAGPTEGLAERRDPESRPASPVRTALTSHRVPRPLPPVVPGTHQMTLPPSTAPQRVPLPSPPDSSLPALASPASDSLRAASPTLTHLLATVVTDPSFESTAASALVTELVDFAAHCRLDFATSLVAESASVCLPSVGDNKAMLALCQEHRLEHRTKHIALRYFLARELQQRGQLCLAYVASQANTVDFFTKALQPCDHQRFCTLLGLLALLCFA
ncbi:unnamed protein product, partial [Closterium sp. NIES-53]